LHYDYESILYEFGEVPYILKYSWTSCISQPLISNLNCVILTYNIHKISYPCINWPPDFCLHFLQKNLDLYLCQCTSLLMENEHCYRIVLFLLEFEGYSVDLWYTPKLNPPTRYSPLTSPMLKLTKCCTKNICEYVKIKIVFAITLCVVYPRILPVTFLCPPHWKWVGI
jgi:hypothetical protein